MVIQAKNTLKRIFRAYRKMGAKEFARGAPRFIRQRLPVGLWPPLLIDPRNTADDVVELPERPALEVEYTGQFEEELPRQLANFEGKISSPENAVYVYTDCEVVGRYPSARIDDKYLLPSWFGVDTPFFLHQKKFLKRNLPLRRVLKSMRSGSEPARTIETGFLVLGERGSNIYGWFHEVLPKLWCYEQYCKQTGESPVLILNSPLKPYQRKSLQWLGYDPSSWIEHGSEVSKVNKLVVAPHPIRLEGNPSSGFASELKWARDRILANLPERDETFSDRIYISRADADRRHVRNEDVVVDALEERGFERYIPGTMSLEEQAKLFANADMVVGLHGLAYFNLMYCDSETTLLELFPEDGVDESYFVVANEYDMTYEFMVCDSAHEGDNERPINKDITVDLDRFERVVDRLIEESGRHPRQQSSTV